MSRLALYPTFSLKNKLVLVGLSLFALTFTACGKSQHSEGTCKSNGTMAIKIEQLYEQTSASNKDGFERFDLSINAKRVLAATHGRMTLIYRGEIYEQNFNVPKPTIDKTMLRAIEINPATLEMVMHSINHKSNLLEEESRQTKLATDDSFSSLLYNSVESVLQVTMAPQEEAALIKNIKKSAEKESGGQMLVCGGKIKIYAVTDNSDKTTRAVQIYTHVDVNFKKYR